MLLGRKITWGLSGKSPDVFFMPPFFFLLKMARGVVVHVFV